MKLGDMKPGLLGLAGALGASACCVLPLTVAVLGLGTGAFMAYTMPLRPLLYPLGLAGLATAIWLYRRERRRCDALACRMAGGRFNLTLIVVAGVLMAAITYVDFFLVAL